MRVYVEDRGVISHRPMCIDSREFYLLTVRPLAGSGKTEDPDRQFGPASYSLLLLGIDLPEVSPICCISSARR